MKKSKFEKDIKDEINALKNYIRIYDIIELFKNEKKSYYYPS
jgi:hypothetical protein